MFGETKLGRALREWTETGSLAPIVEFMNGEGDLPARDRRSIAKVLAMVQARSVPRKRGERSKTPMKNWTPQRRAAWIALQHRQMWEDHHGQKMPDDQWNKCIEESAQLVRENFGAGTTFEQVKAVIRPGHDLSP